MRSVTQPRVAVIGMGWVGASVAISSLHRGVAGELLLNDINSDLAEGEAMDLVHGGLFHGDISVRAAGLAEIAETCDAAVITAGRGSRPGETRLDLLSANAAIVGSIASHFRGSSTLLVIVTNPVDVMTYVACGASGLPPRRVIGTGTMLDSARLRQVVGRELGIDSRSVHAHVAGEHGDSEICLWSSAHVGGRPLRQWEGWIRERELSCADEVRRAAYEIIRRKGATNHAIGLVTAELLRGILKGERRILTVSSLQERVAGVENVALSLPTLVTEQGAERVFTPDLDEDERTALERSAGVLSSAIDALETAG
ncbi:MAG TPA: L-lactate dehydrogenase [Thermoanaerobaculia bacterium]|nr:L-lactate dehydrogenase [Thermoanaerobaculia bacterium]